MASIGLWRISILCCQVCIISVGVVGFHLVGKISSYFGWDFIPLLSSRQSLFVSQVIIICFYLVLWVYSPATHCTTGLHAEMVNDPDYGKRVVLCCTWNVHYAQQWVSCPCYMFPAALLAYSPDPNIIVEFTMLQWQQLGVRCNCRALTSLCTNVFKNCSFPVGSEHSVMSFLWSNSTTTGTTETVKDWESPHYLLLLCSMSPDHHSKRNKSNIMSHHQQWGTILCFLFFFWIRQTFMAPTLNKRRLNEKTNVFAKCQYCCHPKAIR